MKQKYKIDKLNNSFANGENEIEQIEYEMYSDDEEKKKMILKKIKRHCVLKHDFFLYLNDESTEKKILKLKKQLKYTNPVDIEKEYREFKCDNNKLYERFKKENNLNQTINIFNTNKKVTIKEIINNIKIHNLQFPNDKWENVFFHKKKYKSAEKKNSFYYNIDKNVNKYYSHLIGYNIPKILKEFKKYSRKDLYKTFTLYKNLITLCYGLNKSKIILENGIDFQTFWRCVNEISTEKSKFVEKLFKEINSKKSSLLSMKDFFNGMYYIQNTDIKEKIDLFLRAIDESGKGVLNYNEVVSICKDAIKRNLSDDINLNGEIALEDLSIFFAGLIFKLLNHEKNELISMEDIKKGIVEGSIESQYLEMFCGT
jgi:Ca2+-binding EF-hand superfamily protein